MPDLHNPSAWTRRQFLHTSIMASAALSAPAFLSRAALAAAPRSASTASVPGVPEERVLVVVQLGGGNDGLNTVIPFRDDAYHNARPSIAIPPRDVINLGQAEDVGLHPAASPLADLYNNGLLSIVQGVGYPNPNRSHFKSMDIWQTADTSGKGLGWLGRYMDNTCHGSPADDARAAANNNNNNNNNTAAASQPAIAIGKEAPLALQGERASPVAFESQDLFRWTGHDLHPSLSDPYETLNNSQANHQPNHRPHGPSNADFLLRTAMDAQVASEDIRRAARQGTVRDFPRTQLGQQLALVSAMIRAGLKTRVYYVSMGGFDTHAAQGGPQGTHANLLTQFSEALKAFYDDLKAHENHGRVLTLTFSEFGRRVAQNGSGGTDHGAAAPLFLAGPMVRPGVINRHPSLTDLDNGDLKHSLDFRSVYAGVLEDWLKADHEDALGARFRPAKLVRA